MPNQKSPVFDSTFPKRNLTVPSLHLSLLGNPFGFWANFSTQSKSLKPSSSGPYRTADKLNAA